MTSRDPASDPVAGHAAASGQPTPHTVEIWLYSLIEDDAAVDGMREILSAQERARAERLAHPDHKRRYIVAHARMRQILGLRVGRRPEDLAFCVSPDGKPYLAPETPKAVHFNLSHCADNAALAICETAEVGVDIEAIRPVRDGFARRFFTAQEAEEIDALPDDEQRPALFRCWTRKEAFLKATGEGIKRGLASFQVSLAPGEPACVIAIGGDAQAAKDWVLYDFCPAAGLAGAAALIAPDGVQFTIRELHTID